MRNSIFLAGFLFLLNHSSFGQVDTLSPKSVVESILLANSKTKEISIDLSNPEEIELALKKIHTYKYLETLTLNGECDETSLRNLFFRLSVLKNLSGLNLIENELLKIPDNISTIKSLRILSVVGNTNLDYNDFFTHLKKISLTELHLIDNDLKTTPPLLSEMSTLRKIRLSGSDQLNYTDFVDQLTKLPLLNTLSIPVNYIAELPKNIDQLKSLQILDVSNNNLMELPDEISSLKAINNLSIQGNLLLNPAKDLGKLKGNNIQYLALDKEIAAEDLEQIKKLFPDAQIDFPLNKEEEINKTNTPEKPTTKPIYKGELTAKKEVRILSPAYAMYPAYFQSPPYTFDTLNFDQRHQDIRYKNVYQRMDGRSIQPGEFYFRKTTDKYELPGKKGETWFRFGTNDNLVSSNYPELRAFSSLYWVYQGDLTKKQFKRKYLLYKKKKLFSRRRNRIVRWNDIRIEFDKNNSLFSIQLKSDSGFTKFTAFPKTPLTQVEKTQQTYNKLYLIYKKALLRRSQNFNKTLLRNKRSYDLTYKKVSEDAWKELQVNMSDEEKTMSKEDWFEYFDNVIADEQNILDKTELSRNYILRALAFRDYTTNLVSGNQPSQTASTNRIAFKIWTVDFIDQKGNGKLPVTTVYVLDNKNNTITETSSTLGLFPTAIDMKQFSYYSILVELRNGNWGLISAEEIDKQVIEPNKTHRLKTLVFDKNLNTIGELLKNALN